MNELPLSTFVFDCVKAVVGVIHFVLLLIGVCTVLDWLGDERSSKRTDTRKRSGE